MSRLSLAAIDAPRGPGYREYCVKVLTYVVTHSGPLSESQLRKDALAVVRAEGERCTIEVVELPVKP